MVVCEVVWKQRWKGTKYRFSPRYGALQASVLGPVAAPTVIKFRVSRQRKDCTTATTAVLSHGTKSPAHRCCAATSELSSLVRAPLFVSLRYTIFLWPWIARCVDGCCRSHCCEVTAVRSEAYSFLVSSLCIIFSDAHEVNARNLGHTMSVRLSAWFKSRTAGRILIKFGMGLDIILNS
jgi:hypothetical protein